MFYFACSVFKCLTKKIGKTNPGENGFMFLDYVHSRIRIKHACLNSIHPYYINFSHLHKHIHVKRHENCEQSCAWSTIIEL